MSKLTAYLSGVKDAKAGRERKNASDVWGPFDDDYYRGYSDAQYTEEVKALRKERNSKNLDHLSAKFDFSGKR